MKIKTLIAAAVKAGRYSVDRFVRLVYFDVKLHRMAISLPLYRSMSEPDLPGEPGWERWEMAFLRVSHAGYKRGNFGKESRFYHWRYDGRVRWKLWITDNISAAWGLEHDDISLPNTTMSGPMPPEEKL